MKSVTLAEETRSRAVLQAVTQQTYRANELALKWGRHWRNLVKCRARSLQNIPRKTDKENHRVLLPTGRTDRKSNFLETPKFYEGFKELQRNRPAPRIPNFLVQKQC